MLQNFRHFMVPFVWSIKMKTMEKFHQFAFNNNADKSGNKRENQFKIMRAHNSMKDRLCSP